MSTVKVQCTCGQRYAFDVEPIDGRMPYTVACPICGMDGTPAADRILAQNAQPVVATAASSAMVAQKAAPLRVHLALAPAPAASAPAAAPAARLLPGQVARPQALQEARA